ncbi:hypothetical protein QT990_14125 [Microcoleus sp. T3_B1]|uniref:hypothetical protein n=1 Tax=Microcoleus sp. T3_B1 TaxID=3055425 RepID=UPI002FCECBF2
MQYSEAVASLSVRNYQVIPPNPIGVFPGKASHIKSGRSIDAGISVIGNPRGGDRLGQRTRTNKNNAAGLDIRGEKSVLGFLKLETASMYGQRRRANPEDVALKLPGFFKT